MLHFRRDGGHRCCSGTAAGLLEAGHVGRELRHVLSTQCVRWRRAHQLTWRFVRVCTVLFFFPRTLLTSGHSAAPLRTALAVADAALIVVINGGVVIVVVGVVITADDVIVATAS